MAQSSPGSYRQVIGHVDRVSKLQAEQKRDRAADVEHNRQIADAHRKYNKSWEWGVDLEGKSREVALKLDAMVRGQSYDFEMKSIQQAQESAVNNANQLAADKKVEMDQLTNLVSKVTGIASQYIENRDKARDVATNEAAQQLSNTYEGSTEALIKYKGIDTANLTDHQIQEAHDAQAKAMGTPVEWLTNWKAAPERVKLAVKRNAVGKQLERIVPIAFENEELRDPETGLNYKELIKSKDPEVGSRKAALLTRQKAQILKLYSEQGLGPISPLDPSIKIADRNIAAVRAADHKLAEGILIEKHALNQQQVLLEQFESNGVRGWTEPWTKLSGGIRRQTAVSDLGTINELTQQGIIDQNTINKLGNTIIPDTGKTINEVYGGQMLEIQKSLNEVKNIERSADSHEKREQQNQITRGLMNLKNQPPLTEDQGEALLNRLKQLGPVSDHHTALIEASIKRGGGSQAKQQWESYSASIDNSGLVSPAVLNDIVRDATPAEELTIRNAQQAQLNKNQTYKKARRDNERLVRQVGGAGALQLSTKAEIGRAHDALDRIWKNDVIDYLGEEKGLQWAYNQANAKFKVLEAAVQKDPYGDHILKLVNQADEPNNPRIFKHDFGSSAIVEPISQTSNKDLEEIFLTNGVEDPYIHIEANKKVLQNNPGAFRHVLSDGDLIDFMDVINNPSSGEIPIRPYGTLLKFKPFVGSGDARKTAELIAQSRGITLPKPGAQNGRVQKIWDSFNLDEINQMGGMANAGIVMDGMGEPHTGGANYDAMVFPPGYNLKVASRHRVDPLAQAKAYGGRDYNEPRPQGHNHHGEDIAMPKGTQMIMREGGTVIESTFDSVGGNSIYIKFDDGTLDRYLHLDERFVSGGRVTPGMVIGTVGNTGRSYGSHLHWESYASGGLQGGDLRDPMTAGTPKFEFGVYGGNQ